MQKSVIRHLEKSLDHVRQLQADYSAGLEAGRQDGRLQVAGKLTAETPLRNMSPEFCMGYRKGRGQVTLGQIPAEDLP